MRRTGVLLAVASLVLVTAGAWGFWSVGSVPGGNGAAVSSTVNQGSTPSASANGRAVTVSWAASTLTNGQAVTGYEVRRYAAGTLALQTIGSACSGTLTTTSCVESRVPSGDWVYAVTPLFGPTWRGAESVRSSPVTVAAPTLTLAGNRVKPGTSASGSVAGFLSGETVRYRLDSPTGPELSGSLAGSPTPATVPASGGGSAVITVPAGTSEGPHTLYAVASPSGDATVADIVVDNTPPPVPVITGNPMTVSGDAATFTFTISEATATAECNIDSESYVACASPVEYAGLAQGLHTFRVRSVDTVGNTSAAAEYTWTVNTTIPTVSITFPGAEARLNDAGFNAGCPTPTAGDVCGIADDDGGVTAVAVSLRRLSTGLYWNGSSFSSLIELFQSANGTTDWSYAITASALPEGDYELRGRASDGVNVGFDSRTFTIDRTPPVTPTLTSAPGAESGPTATFAFTHPEPGVGFECRLDGGAWTPCASPRAYSGLAHGPHTVNVRAVDAAGNAGSATTTTWTVDATPPTAAMSFPTATNYNPAGWTAGCGTPTAGDLCGTADDVGGGLASVSVSILKVATSSYWDGSAFAAPSETWLTATGTSSWTYAFAAADFPADGSYTVRWRAVDRVGNTSVGSRTLVFDATPPPAPQFVSAPADPSGPTAHFDFTDDEPGVQTECRLDGGPWTACTPPVDYTGLSAGDHTFDVRAVDAAGNTSVLSSHTWTVDNGFPNVAITFPSASRSYNDATYAAGCGTPGTGDLCGTASDPQGNLVSVTVSIQRVSTSLYWDGTGFTSATEVQLPATGLESWSLALAAAAFPAEGGYMITARATDAVGLTALESATITIDRTAPSAPTITSGPTGTTAGGDTFTFTGEAGATFECRVDGGAWAACSSPVSYPALADGPHTFDVRDTDAAGNVGPLTSRSWTIDATAPVVATTFPLASSAHNNTTWKSGCADAVAEDLCGTASDAGGSVALVEVTLRRASTGLYWNGSGFSAVDPVWLTATGTSTWTLPFAATGFPADGSYELSVRARDQLGNTSAAATRTFSIDRTGPGAASLAAVNRGSIVRRIETGDQLVLTYSEPINPGSLIAGWNGTGTQNITIRQANNTNDLLTFYNSANTTRLPLGSVQLKRNDYVTGAVVWGASGTRSTLTMSGNTLTLTFGTPDQPTRVTTAAAAANMVWLPRAGVTAGTGVTDLVGNLGTSTNRAETDADNDF